MTPSLRCQQRGAQIVPDVPKPCCRRSFPAQHGETLQPVDTSPSPCLCHPAVTTSPSQGPHVPPSHDAAAPRVLIRGLLGTTPLLSPPAPAVSPGRGGRGPGAGGAAVGLLPGWQGACASPLPGSPRLPHALEGGTLAPASARDSSHVHSWEHLWQLPSARLAWGDGCWRATVTRWSYQQDVTPPQPSGTGGLL